MSSSNEPIDSHPARQRLGDDVLNQLFITARTHNVWLPTPVSDATVRDLYEMTKWGPTSGNTNPARFVFVRSAAAKERLKPHLSPGNADKTMSAPCCVIVAYDSLFYELMPKLFPSRDMRSGFANNLPKADESAKRNSSLQGAYLIVGARALGLDCGPMSGFDAAKLDAEFFPDGRWKSNFLCNIGYGVDAKLFPRNPRLDFAEACLDL